ncbi:MAG: hypothetical protein DVB26_01560 [Verrucomicrobia bacterium]|nr:MAG: hypothetical protein DVB26_01560 [Verrucomicrobiota bacterium]
MKPILLLGLAALAAIAAAIAAAPAAEPPRALPLPEAAAVPVAPPAGPAAAGGELATSRSGQFRVSSADGLLRGTVAMMAEDAKGDLLLLTGEKDEWKVPVSIVLHGKPGDPLPPRSVAMKLLFSEAGDDLRLDVHLGRGIEAESFKHATTTILLYERALRGRRPGRPETPLMVAPWLVEGLREASSWQLKSGDRRLYEALFKHGGLFKLDELFTLNESQFEELDGVMHAAFRVSAGSLVMALLKQPQGHQGFLTFLSESAAFDGEMPALLRRHFPELNLSETSLAKWWALQLAEMTTPTLTEVLTIAETEAALDDALHLDVAAAEGGLQRKPLADWRELDALKPAERVEAVRLAQDGLVHLSYRCFPSYRPLIGEYQTALAAIARHKTRKTADQLADLRETRGALMAKASRGRDYLDWFEITRARQTSGVFEDYLRLKQRLAAQPHNRDDSLSKYLDRMNQIFVRNMPDSVSGLPANPPPETPIDLPKP